MNPVTAPLWLYVASGLIAAALLLMRVRRWKLWALRWRVALLRGMITFEEHRLRR